MESSEHFVYLSEIVGRPIRVASAREDFGVVADLSTPMKLVYPKIGGILVRRRGDRRRWYLPWEEVVGVSPCRVVEVRREPTPLEGATTGVPDEVLLK